MVGLFSIFHRSFIYDHLEIRYGATETTAKKGQLHFCRFHSIVSFLLYLWGIGRTLFIPLTLVYPRVASQ